MVPQPEKAKMIVALFIFGVLLFMAVQRMYGHCTGTEYGLTATVLLTAEIVGVMFMATAAALWIIEWLTGMPIA